MIKFERFGVEYAIEDEDWNQLRERFNPKNALFTKAGGFFIAVECPFCRKHGCSKCPLSKPLAESSIVGGCTRILMKLYRNKYFSSLYIPKISWEKKYNKQARRQLYRLQRIMDEIELESHFEQHGRAYDSQ